MHSPRTVLPLALAGLLALAACGSRPATPPGGPAQPPADGSECAVAAPASGRAVPSPTASARDGVRITAADAGCVEFEVTNPEAEAYVYTVTLDLGLPGPGHTVRTLPYVAGGRTVHDAVRLNAGPTAVAPLAGGRAGTPKVVLVRSVPVTEAPPAPGVCPPSGLRLTADQGSAAMGLRAVGLLLENCGAAPLRLNGFPSAQPLGLDHRPVDGVAVLRGGSAIATGTGAEDTAREFELRPGGSARSVITWRNTTGLDGAPVLAPYLRVRATSDAAPVTVTPELDLGTTGRLGVGAWVPAR
ncbi:DUF4232 domain-containing protein [Kitasatospora sp. NPDC051853]|uniref:DUF4232 domain-containing protein n=1 Tax=Kitasatospora sp. NPDC051853 TaxID=3364058 RepID=UPI0037926C40